MATELIRIPSERADQLRALAQHKGTTVSALVGDLVSTEISRLGILREIGVGGFDVADLEDGNVAFSAHPLGSLTWSKETARDVAETLVNIATNRGRGSGGAINVDASLEFSRAGAGIRLKNIETDRAQIIATTVATDLAKLIYAHAR